MIIKSLRVRNFRNIEECNISFSPKVNLLKGENAQGKTNAIEAVYLFARGRSFRTCDDKELIKFGKEGFYCEIEYTDKSGENRLEYSLFGKTRQRKKNGYKLKSARELLSNFRAVLFYPDDLMLVKGGPDLRRDFLNIGISQCYPSYIDYFSGMKKALENRNALIKSANKGLYIDERELLSWSEVLAEYSSYIYLYRKEYIKKLEVYSKRCVFDISDGKEIMELRYKSNINSETDLTREEIKERYVEILRENTEKEIYAGVSLYGPQRDDLEIMINGKEARSFASQGQQRSIVLSLKLAEGEVSREICGEYPVYLFDDVLSELDERRKKYVLSGNSDKQIIISSCEDNEGIIIPDREIKVCGGNYI